MITFAYVLGLLSVAIAAIFFWGGYAEEGRAVRLAQRSTTP
jgi:hypothetical protein